jgi:hypothetical protein
VYTDYFTKYLMAIPVKVITLSNMELEEGGYPDEMLPSSPPSLSHLGKETSLRSGERVTHGATLTVSEASKLRKQIFQHRPPICPSPVPPEWLKKLGSLFVHHIEGMTPRQDFA